MCKKQIYLKRAIVHDERNSYIVEQTTLHAIVSISNKKMNKRKTVVVYLFWKTQTRYQVIGKYHRHTRHPMAKCHS